MKRKKIIALVAALAVSALGFGALSYFSGTAEKKENQFNIVAGQKDQNDAGTIQEPAQENGGKADAAAGLQPDQIVPKDPYIVSNVDQSAQAIMKVEVPKFTEEPNKGKLAAELLNVNADGKWKLLDIQDTDEWHTVIYGYTEPLAGNNSTKPEEERARTSSLFDSFKITGNISLANTYTGVIRVSGTLLQTEGNTTVDDAASDVHIVTKNQTVTYDANGGYFNDDPAITTNAVSYTREVGHIKKIAKTPNIQDDGTDDGSGQGDQAKNIQLITIPGATQLHVTVTYQTGDDDVDESAARLEIWDKKVNFDSWRIPASVSGVMVSKNKTTKEFIINGDTAEFGFFTHGPESQYYGYYATVEADGANTTTANGSVIEPTHDTLRFHGQYTTENCEDGTQIEPEDCTSDMTVYAKQGETTFAKLDISKWEDLRWNITDGYYQSGVYAFRRSKDKKLSQNEANVISTADSEYPIYLAYEDNTLMYYTKADMIQAGSLASMFKDMHALNDISGLKDFDVSKTTSLRSLFDTCHDITDISPLSEQDTSNVTDMDNIFGGIYGDGVHIENVDALAKQDTSKVTNMTCMFRGCTYLNDISGLKNQDVSSVENMGAMFDACELITDLTPLKNQNVSHLQMQEYGDGMFGNCTGLQTLNGLENQDVRNCKSFRRFFNTCTNLTDISALKNQDVSNVNDFGGMFIGCSKLNNITPLSNQNTSNARTLGDVNDGMFEDCTSLTDISAIANQNTSSVTEMQKTFFNCTSLKNLEPLVNWNTSNVEDMSEMFLGCSSLKTLHGLENWDVSNARLCSGIQTSSGSVITRYGMFSNCTSLVDASAINNQDIQGPKLKWMFNNCPTHPEFTKRSGTWDNEGTFTVQS